MQNTSFKKLMAKPYFRLLVSYIIILTIIIIFFTVNYYRIANSIKEEKIRETFISLQHTCNAIDEQIFKFRRLLHNISDNDEIRRIALLNTPLMPAHYQWLLDAYKVIDKYELIGGIIAECVIVFNPGEHGKSMKEHIIME